MKNDDLYYELNYINTDNNNALITSIFNIKEQYNGLCVNTINNNDIDSLTKDSPHSFTSCIICL
ncbi:hypothetical protein [Helicobacter didelphidarum]|uniref:hypothetical protein n=1 Tax=Helicobacter didelphidarum TaxID=2040648 RepID=UPI0015F1B95C|nr:hypothetical protein [Helicobacter didelphidarum]